MAGWKDAFHHLAYDLETQFDEFKYSLEKRLGGDDPIKILPYNGLGNAQRLCLKGRVLEDHNVRPAMDNDDIWDNLLNMYKRLESDEIPHARIKARFGDQEQIVQANEEGYFSVCIDLKTAPPTDRIWHSVELELVEPRPRNGSEPVRAKGEVLVPPPSAEYVVISDIDDTVMQSHVTDMIKMARSVFLSNARTRLPFPGVAAFYRALYSGSTGNSHNPLFFVSSSPWNLYDLLVDFFHLQNIPIGPVLFLRDWGITETEILPIRNRNHKLKAIREILDFYPDLPFILIGDSGQEDPEIYSEIVKENPVRFLATYIRNVSHNLKRADEINELAQLTIQAGSDMVLANDTVAIAEHAIRKNWIEASRLPEIIGEKDKDETPQTPLENILETPKSEGSTTVVKVEGEKEAEQAAEAIEEGALEDLVENTGDKQEQKPPTIVVESNPEEKKEDKTS